MESPLRLGGYVRVSRIGDRDERLLSPKLQRNRIDAWAKAGGHRVVDLREDLDVSGGRSDRENLLALVERIEAGELDGLIVATLDRFGRSLAHAIELIERIDKAGGRFVSVADGFDTRTEYGRLALHIMLSVADFELRRFKRQWRETVEHKIREGHHPGPVPLFGYERASSGRLAPEPTTAPIVTELFNRYANGETLSALARDLNDRGVVTQRNRRVTRRFLHKILVNPAYLGQARSGELVQPDAHPALIDATTFARCQMFKPRPGRTGPPAALAGLVRCQGCRYAMAPVMREGSATAAASATSRDASAPPLPSSPRKNCSESYVRTWSLDWATCTPPLRESRAASTRYKRRAMRRTRRS